MIPGEELKEGAKYTRQFLAEGWSSATSLSIKETGAILKRDLALRHRPPILNRRGEPQFAFPKDPDYLEYAFAEGNAIAVVPKWNSIPTG